MGAGMLVRYDGSNTRRGRTTRYTRKTRRQKKRSVNQANYQFILRQVGTVSATSGVITEDFKPSDVTGYSDWSALQALYDNFEVKAISVTLRPINVGDESGSTPHTRGNLVSIVDMDGNSLPTGIATAYEYNSLKFHDSREVARRYIRIPKRYRPKLNDLATGFDADNMDSTIRFLGDNFSDSSQFWFMSKIYVTCTGRR